MYEIKSVVYSRKEIEVLERLLNKECLNIYRETKAVKYGEEYQFCEDAVVVCAPDINPEIVKYPNKNCYNLFQIKDDKIEMIDIPTSGIPYIRYPVSGPFFRRAEFYYGFDFGKRQCCLIYQFGPRWGRCLMYQLLCAYLITRYFDGTYIMLCFPISFSFGMIMMIGYYLFSKKWKEIIRTGL